MAEYSSQQKQIVHDMKYIYLSVTNIRSELSEVCPSANSSLLMMAAFTMFPQYLVQGGLGGAR